MRIVSLIFCFLALSTVVALADAPIDFSGQWVASDKSSNDGDKSDSDSMSHSSGSHGGGESHDVSGSAHSKGWRS